MIAEIVVLCLVLPNDAQESRVIEQVATTHDLFVDLQANVQIARVRGLLVIAEIPFGI